MHTDAPTGVRITAASGTSPQAGESVTLTCSYTSSLPAPNSYTWYRGDQQLEGSRREMVLKSITVEQAGEYRCQANNGIGQTRPPHQHHRPLHAPTGVHVTAASGTSPQAGKSVTLTCSYTSSLPAPNSYTWYRGDQQLEGSRREMVLKSITAEQAGEYRCQADNGIGQSRSPPHHHHRPVCPHRCPCYGSAGHQPAGRGIGDANVQLHQEPPRPQLLHLVLGRPAAERIPAGNGVEEHHGGAGWGVSLPGQQWDRPVPVPSHQHHRPLHPPCAGCRLHPGTCRARGAGSQDSWDQPGPGETPMSERIYENTQHYGMGKPACLAPPGAPSAPTEVCPGSPDSTRESHIYSQPMNTGKVPQSDPDEVHYAAVQLQPLTRRAEPVADLTCEYAVIKS
ncbi:unnamed protein product [Lepidochelys kempii]